MTRRIAVLALIFSGLCFSGLAAWAADDALPPAATILDHYIEVTGGKAAYERRKTEVATGTVEIAGQGLRGTLTRYSEAPGKIYLSMEFAGIGKIESGVADGVAWDTNAMTGPHIKTGDEKAQAIQEAAFNADLNWRALYPKVETAGVETVNGEECYKVVRTPAQGKPETSWYSKKTGLVVKTSTVAASQMGDVPVEQIVSDYKNFDGVLMPSHLSQTAAGQEMSITIDSMKVNVEIPPDRFDPPAAIKALLKKASN